jgi:hypothetical protein
MKTAPRRCPVCRGSLASGASECVKCGLVLDAASIECENHPEVPARSLCVVCGKPLCDACSLRRQDKHVCRENDHASILAGSEVLRSVGSPLAADLIITNLMLHGIDACAYDRNAFDSGRSFAGSRRTVVWTKREDLRSALALLTDLEIDGLEEEKGPDASKRGSPAAKSRPMVRRKRASRSSR